MGNSNLWTLTESEVTRLGIPATFKGYYYLVIAVVLSVQIGMRKVSLSKDIYQRIADMNNVTISSVERDIRNCLVRAWRDNRDLLLGIYGRTAKMPTNSEVIACITSRIRLETALRI